LLSVVGWEAARIAAISALQLSSFARPVRSQE
jgi:hypothetical protein